MIQLPLKLFACKACNQLYKVFLFDLDPMWGYLQCKCSKYPIVYSTIIFSGGVVQWDKFASVLPYRQKRIAYGGEVILNTMKAAGNDKIFSTKIFSRVEPEEIFDRWIDYSLANFEATVNGFFQKECAERFLARPAGIQFMASTAYAETISRERNIAYVGCDLGQEIRAIQSAHRDFSLALIVTDNPVLPMIIRRFIYDKVLGICIERGKPLPFVEGTLDACMFSAGDVKAASSAYSALKGDGIMLLPGTNGEDISKLLTEIKPANAGVVSSERLLDAQLKGTELQLSPPTEISGAENYTAVVSKQRDIYKFQPGIPAVVQSDLRPNPIYSIEEGDTAFKLTMKDGVRTFVAESMKKLGILPEKCEVPRSQLTNAIHKHELSPDIGNLIRSFVLTNVSDSYR